MKQERVGSSSSVHYVVDYIYIFIMCLWQDITVYEPVPMMEGKPYSYIPPSIETQGPDVPPLEDLEDLG